jgi:hypothetical protein
MAHWKRLHGIDGIQVDVNMENVAYMTRVANGTGIYCVGGKGDRYLVHNVKETPDQIHALNPINSA